MNKIAISFFVLSVSVSNAFAEDTAKSPMAIKTSTPTTEQREKMALAHDKMSACLRTDRPLEDCREEMMNACKENRDGCMMMDGKRMRRMKREAK